MLPNPCPCTTLQWGVKVVAIVGPVFDLLNIFKITAILGGVDASDNFLLRGLQETSHPILIVSLILNMILLGVDIVLYLGAQKRNATMCWVWLGCTLVNFLYSVINSILKLYGDYGTTYVEILVVGVIGLIHGIAITIYVMFVVYAS
ncbi:hypothetical protein Ocin01_18658 [Orchesella cincta]|uniref:Uncharacterized protein n=1 Tax=Orchesella cincta TaxID=48709 RepID=A0A1D2M4X5_ORCCI|nr:hypothetical protein Ocin01_18658 [Orchesella cincta]